MSAFKLPPSSPAAAVAGGVINSLYGELPEVPDASLPDFVLRECAARGEQEYVVDALNPERKITHAQMPELTRRFAQGLVEKCGLQQKDVLAVFSPNVIEYPVVFFGAVSAGVVLTTVNPAYTVEELVHQLEDSNAKAVVTVGGPVLEKVLEARGQCAAVKHIVVIGGESKADSDVVSYADFINNDGSSAPRPEIDSRDVVCLPYSSGTTGLSKGVMLSHRNIVANLMQFVTPELVEITPNDTLVGLLPFYHIYGLTVIMAGALYGGARIAVLPKFTPPTFLKTLQDFKVTTAHVVPPICVLLAKAPVVDEFKLDALEEVFSGAAPLGAELTTALMKRLKLKRVRQGYGMSELSPVATVTPADVVAPGSAGRLVRGTEAKVIDVDSKQPITEPDKEGELWIRGPQVMEHGYLNNEEATRHTIDEDGFLHTGDIVKFDAEGSFFVTDRLKELIKVKGFQVAPAEIEAILMGNDRIADAAVIGRKPAEDSESVGELIVAFVVKKDAALTGEEVKAYVKQHVAKYKEIQVVEFVDSIPKSASGKILRRILRQK